MQAAFGELILFKEAKEDRAHEVRTCAEQEPHGERAETERPAENAEKDERDLLLYLSEADRRGIRFALSNIISRDGQTNRPLAEWLEQNPRFTPHRLDYNYSNANYHKKNRDKSPVEVLITNYV